MTARVIVGHGLTDSGWVQAALVVAPKTSSLLSMCRAVSNMLHSSGYKGAQVAVRDLLPSESGANGAPLAASKPRIEGVQL